MLTPDTIRNYRSVAAELKRQPLEAERRRTWAEAFFDEIGEEDIRAYHWMLEHRGLAASTLNQRRAVVSGMWSYACEQLRVRDPVNVIAIWKYHRLPRRRRRSIYTPAQIGVLASLVDDLQDALIILVSAFCGLRAGEMRGLLWRHVDLELRHLHHADYDSARREHRNRKALEIGAFISLENTSEYHVSG